MPKAITHFARSRSVMLYLGLVLLTTQLYGCDQDPEPDYQIKAVVLPAGTDSAQTDAEDTNKKKQPSAAAD